MRMLKQIINFDEIVFGNGIDSLNFWKVTNDFVKSYSF